MSFAWGSTSLARLELADADLQRWAHAWLAESPNDLRIETSTRGKAAQAAKVAAGNSRAAFGSSPHNYAPALALDIEPLIVHPSTGKLVVPWKEWDGSEIRREGGGAVSQIWRDHGARGLAVAKRLGIALTWGGHFRSLYDCPHFERTDWRERRGKLAP
jgi:peptidoglycan L-alanyl-D-glutamate endopeptidase CwlK